MVQVVRKRIEIFWLCLPIPELFHLLLPHLSLNAANLLTFHHLLLLLLTLSSSLFLLLLVFTNPLLQSSSVISLQRIKEPRSRWRWFVQIFLDSIISKYQGMTPLSIRCSCHFFLSFECCSQSEAEKSLMVIKLTSQTSPAYWPIGSQIQTHVNWLREGLTSLCQLSKILPVFLGGASLLVSNWKCITRSRVFDDCRTVWRCVLKQDNWTP